MNKYILFYGYLIPFLITISKGFKIAEDDESMNEVHEKSGHIFNDVVIRFLLFFIALIPALNIVLATRILYNGVFRMFRRIANKRRLKRLKKENRILQERIDKLKEVLNKVNHEENIDGDIE